MYACAHAATARAQASVKQLYQTAVDRRKRHNEKIDTQREQMYAKKVNSMARAEILQPLQTAMGLASGLRDAAQPAGVGAGLVCTSEPAEGERLLKGAPSL